MLAWVTGPKPAAFPLPDPAQQGRQWYYGNGGIRYLIARDPSYNTFDYAPEKFRERVLEISKLMDSTNPDLSEFEQARRQADPQGQRARFCQKRQQHDCLLQGRGRQDGPGSVDRFMRFYVNPGASHAGGGVSGTDGSAIPRAVDFLGALDAWVTKGDAPGTLIADRAGAGAAVCGLGDAPALPLSGLSALSGRAGERGGELCVPGGGLRKGGAD